MIEEQRSFLEENFDPQVGNGKETFMLCCLLLFSFDIYKLSNYYKNNKKITFISTTCSLDCRAICLSFKTEKVLQPKFLKKKACN